MFGSIEVSKVSVDRQKFGREYGHNIEKDKMLDKVKTNISA